MSAMKVMLAFLTRFSNFRSSFKTKKDKKSEKETEEKPAEVEKCQPEPKSLCEIEPKPETEEQSNDSSKVAEIREETVAAEILVEKSEPPRNETKDELIKIDPPKEEVAEALETNGMKDEPKSSDRKKNEETCVEKLEDKTVEIALEESDPLKPPPLPPKSISPSKVEIDERPSPRTLSLSEAILEELDLTLESEEKAKVEEGKSDVKVYFPTNFRRFVHWTQKARLSNSVEHTETKSNFSKVGKSPNRRKFVETADWPLTTATTSTTTLAKAYFDMGLKYFSGSNSSFIYLGMSHLGCK